MAITGRVPTTFDDKKFIPEAFSKNVLVALKNKLVAVPVFNHSYEPDLVKGDTLYIPQTNTGSAYEITVGKEVQDSNAFNTSAVTLSISNYYGAKHTIDVMTRRQSQVDVIALAETENAYAINKQMDTSVCTLFSTLGGKSTSAYGTDGSPWTDDVLIAAVEYLDEANAPSENRVWIADPSTKADILKIDKFVRMDYFASDAVLTGTFRKDIYGAPLLITNNLVAASTGSYGVYAHKDAIGIVISENPDSFIVEQPLLHQVVLETDALWGVVELRDTFGYPIFTRLA